MKTTLILTLAAALSFGFVVSINARANSTVSTITPSTIKVADDTLSDFNPDFPPDDGGSSGGGDSNHIV